MQKKVLGGIVILILSIALWTALKPAKHFWILYPLETTRQQIHIFDGLRFLGIDESVKAYAAVLNNPVESGGYADIVILSACNSGHNVAVSVESARTRSGEAEIMTGAALKQAMEAGRLFNTLTYPKDLTPKLQEYGCAPVKTKNTLTRQSMDHLQHHVIKLYQAYRAKETQIVLDNILIPGDPETIDGGIFRIPLPHESADTPVIINIKVNLKHYTLRFQLQKLD